MVHEEVIPVTHIITGLNTGGAETMLMRLLKYVDQSRFPCRVISLTSPGPIGQRIEETGIPVLSLEMKPGHFSFSGFLTLLRELKKSPPVIIETWMYHADLLGGLAAAFLRPVKVIWGIHNSTLNPQKTKPGTRAVVRLNAFLSRFLVDRIIVCSKTARRIHEEIGYRKDGFVYIPNGFELSEFRPNPERRKIIRQELGIDKSVPVICLAARFDPQKDHGTFFTAAAGLSKKLPAAHYVLCGDGIEWGNNLLTCMIPDGLDRSNVHLLGRRIDMPAVYSACDVAVLSSSFGEAFPLVIGEAMSCGLPCVATDVGDTAELIGGTGLVVPPDDPKQLEEALFKLLTLDVEIRHEWGQKARERIQDNFDINSIVKKYQDVWLDIAG